MTRSISPPGLLVLLGAQVLLGSCEDSHARTSETATAGSAADAVSADVSDPVLAPSRRELLELAFAAVSAMPLEPHLKNRSRAQEQVLLACLELEQPVLGEAFAREIGNWRRGVAHAELAIHRAERGERDEANRQLELAQTSLDAAREAGEQTWRIDRIVTRAALARLALGEEREAEALVGSVSTHEIGDFAAARARLVSEEELEPVLATLRRALEQNDLDLTRSTLHSLASLYERFFTDVERRGAVLRLAGDHAEAIPSLLYGEFLMDLVGVALELGDRDEAGGLLDELLTTLERDRLSPDIRIPLTARVAALEHRAGRAEAARSRLRGAEEAFVQERRLVTNIDRADVLRAIAEAYHTIGATDEAERLFLAALEAGIENPNSRPRADDLAETCTAMALIGFEPDEELWTRIRAIRAGLGKPW